MNYQEQYDAYLARAKRALEDACRRYLPAESQVCQAARYSLMGGGKRVRAVLVLSVCDMLGGDEAAAESFAAAVEMLHCYSLIHDDLPCMDDDDLRRGKPTNHKVYGEGMAVLAGDSLLTYAFETAARGMNESDVTAQQAVEAIGILAHEAGYYGMIGGQVLDLAAEHQTLTYEELVNLQDKKTGGLIRAAAEMGCVLGYATEEQREAAKTYANRLGLAFQI